MTTQFTPRPDLFVITGPHNTNCAVYRRDVSILIERTSARAPWEGPTVIQSAPLRRVLVSTEVLARSAEWTRRNLHATPSNETSPVHLMRRPPDAVVIDLSNDRVDQQADLWQLCKTLDLPSIVITGQRSGVSLAPILERGADVIIRDPGELQVVAAAAAALIRRSRPRDTGGLPSVVSLDGVEIDLAHRAVRRGQAVLSLSPTEFNLLSVLLRADGRVCTQRELLFKVWGAEYASASHYLRLYVRYLRKKIEVDPAHPRYLVTVRGVGYRLVGTHAESDRASPVASPASAPDIPDEWHQPWNAN